MSTFAKPTVHLNGTSAEALAEQYHQAYLAVHAAIAAMREASPNARDYYVQVHPNTWLTGGDSAYQVARSEHEDRLKKLESILVDLAEIQTHLTEQLFARKP